MGHGAHRRRRGNPADHRPCLAQHARRARCAAPDRPGVRRTGSHAGTGDRRTPRPRAVDRAVRQRPVHRRAAHRARRHTVHGGRRAPAEPRGARTPGRPLDAARRRSHGVVSPRRRLMDGRASSRWSDGRAVTRRARHAVPAHARGVRIRARLLRERIAAPAARAHRRERAHRAARATRGGGLHRAHRRVQRREPAAHARRGPSSRDRRSRRPRRIAGASRRADAGRECRARDRWRDGRGRPGRARRARTSRGAAAGYTATHGHHARWHCARRVRGTGDRDWYRVRSRPGVSRQSRRRTGRASRGAWCRRASRWRAHPRVAGGGRGGADARAGDRGGTDDANAVVAHARRSGIPPRRRAHHASAAVRRAIQLRCAAARVRARRARASSRATGRAGDRRDPSPAALGICVVHEHRRRGTRQSSKRDAASFGVAHHRRRLLPGDGHPAPAWASIQRGGHARGAAGRDRERGVRPRRMAGRGRDRQAVHGR